MTSVATCLRASAVAATRCNWTRERYLATVGMAYERCRGAQSDTRAERLRLAGEVWDALVSEGAR